MVKHSPADSIGYNDITVALSTMTGIAHHINNMKRRHEHAVRVQEVQSLLVGWQVKLFCQFFIGNEMLNYVKLHSFYLVIYLLIVSRNYYV